MVSGPITITPDLNHNGSGGSFAYIAKDAALAPSNTAIVDIAVTAVNDAPVCPNIAATITEDVSGSVSLPCSDPDIGDTIAIEILILSLTGVSGPFLGPVTGPVPLNPDLNHNGSGGSFAYQATDTALTVSNTATATIDVSPVNDAPVLAGLPSSLTLVVGASSSTTLDDKVSDVETAPVDID